MSVRTTLPVGTLPSARSAPRRSKLPPGGSIASTIETFLDAVARAENTNAAERTGRGRGEARPTKDERATDERPNDESGLHRVDGRRVDVETAAGEGTPEVVGAVIAMLGATAELTAPVAWEGEPPRHATVAARDASSNGAPEAAARSERSTRTSAAPRAPGRPSGRRSEAPTPLERSAARGGPKSVRPASRGVPVSKDPDPAADPSRILDAAMAALGAWHIAKSARSTKNDAVQTLPSPLRAAAALAPRGVGSLSASAGSASNGEPGSPRADAPPSEPSVGAVRAAEGPEPERAAEGHSAAHARHVPVEPTSRDVGPEPSVAESAAPKAPAPRTPAPRASARDSAARDEKVTDTSVGRVPVEVEGAVEGAEVLSSSDASVPAEGTSPSPSAVHPGTDRSPRSEEPRQAVALAELPMTQEPDLAPRDSSPGASAALASLLRGGATEARMRVDHPSFGVVTVEIAQQRGELDVALSAPTLEAAVALRGAERSLRAELREAGTDLRNLRVKTRKPNDAGDREPEAWQPRVTNDRRRI